jgi:hypothetical protein
MLRAQKGETAKCAPERPLDGDWEYPAFWTVALVVQALLGDGIYALRMPRAGGAVSELTGAHSR